MKIRVKNREYLLKEINKYGREGEIFSIIGYGDRKFVKVYDKDRRTAYMQRKVNAIINKMKYLWLGGVENYISIPEMPVYEHESGDFCGFMMKAFYGHSELYDNRFDLSEYCYKNPKINDGLAINIIATLFSYLKILHSVGFVLGDISPDNILFDNSVNIPAIVDFDSAQIGSYFSNTNHQEYFDPNVRVDGYGRKKHFIYSIESDLYALAIVSYEFIVGIHPYFYQTVMPTDTEFKMRNGLSLIDCLENNAERLRGYKLTIYENKAYEATRERLEDLKKNNRELYEYFKSVFSNGDRGYYLIKDGKVFTYNLEDVVGADDDPMSSVISESKEDPDELGIFMKSYKLKIY